MRGSNMAFQVSPGVQVQEIDLTNVIPAVSSSAAAFVGNFPWGPVDEITTVSSEKELKSTFGTPTVSNAVDFTTAAYFLKYGSALRTVRAVTDSATNATSDASNDDAVTVVKIYNRDSYDTQVFSGNVTLTVQDSPLISGSTDVTVDDASGITIGDVVTDGTGTGIAAGTTVSNITGNVVTLSQATTAQIEQNETILVAVYKGEVAAKYPGAAGNSLEVHVCTNATAYTTGGPSSGPWEYAGQFVGAPGTSDYAADRGGSDDELHMVVVDKNGYFTGVPGTILETFGFMSQGLDAKNSDGSSNYYKEVINSGSKYIWILNDDANLSNASANVTGTTYVTSDTILTYTLANGVDSGGLADGDYTGGFDLFLDTETVDVSLLIQPESSSTVSQHIMDIADSRKDCVAFVSPPIATTVNNATAAADVITWANGLGSSSYAVFDSTALKVYDRYNDQYIHIPASSSIAGLCARTDETADAWFSPAGYTRGQLRGVTKVAFNPNKTQRDDLYQARVNPIVTFPGEGTVLFGDKTAQSKPSAFDRINVRRLFIVLEKAIATAAKFQLFEFNDDVTRATFRNAVEPFLRDVKSRRGMTDFAVVCDESNNTGEVIDANSFVADIYIKPSRSINFISLNFVATRTGVEFSEIIGQ
jgi:phage tail sheath protein FI